MRLIIILTFIGLSSAHLCLISPPQRGSLTGLNHAGSPDCILLKAPCGGRPEMNPIISIISGKNFTVTFQKNLDHWTKSSPGYFSVDISKSSSDPFKELITIPDGGEPSLHLYSVNVTIPVEMKGSNAVIRSQYVTKNPKAPSVFYQCSDIFVS